MYLCYLRLYQFKNYKEQIFRPHEKINGLLGKNGSGKTNILDAIYYLSFTRSAFQSLDKYNVRYGEDAFSLQGEFRVGQTTQSVTCQYMKGQKKNIQVDQVACTRFSSHIGRFPVVLISPLDIELIWSGAEKRRRFIDTLLAQIDQEYLHQLILYTHCLKQRNTYLRSLPKEAHIDPVLMNHYNQVLSTSGYQIYQKRKALVQDLSAFIKHYYKEISDSSETIEIHYRASQNTSSLAELLDRTLSYDRQLQYTSVGIHRDDFVFLINDLGLKSQGSQGQQKSFLIALKLAEHQLIATKKKYKPLLLMDDIFDKLDLHRAHTLMELVTMTDFGQVFITDAYPDRLSKMLRKTKRQAQYYCIEKGSMTVKKPTT